MIFIFIFFSIATCDNLGSCWRQFSIRLPIKTLFEKSIIWSKIFLSSLLRWWTLRYFNLIFLFLILNKWINVTKGNRASSSFSEYLLLLLNHIWFECLLFLFLDWRILSFSVWFERVQVLLLLILKLLWSNWRSLLFILFSQGRLHLERVFEICCCERSRIGVVHV